MGRSVFASLLCLLFFFFFFSCFPSAEAYHHLDQGGNITIRWDIINWTPHGYIALVSIFNYQESRTIESPGWKLGWTWTRQEVIWSIIGAKTTEQGGNCSKYKQNIPTSCTKTPKIVDLNPNTPLNQQVANCCKGGLMSSWFQDRANSVSSFQLSISHGGSTNRTVRMPRNYTFEAPGAKYVCGPAKIVKPTMFLSEDKRRVTQAYMTWNSTCLYSGPSAKPPTLAPAPSPVNSHSMGRNLASYSLGHSFIFVLGLFVFFMNSC